MFQPIGTDTAPLPQNGHSALRERQHTDLADSGETERTPLVNYVRVLYRRRWIALTTFVVVVTLAAVQTFTAVPVYEASAQVLIETAERNVLTFKDVVEQDRTALNYSETQHRLLRSRALARKTLDALKLWDQPPFGGVTPDAAFSLRNAAFAWAHRIVQFVAPPRPQKPPEPVEASETAAQSSAIDAFVASVSIVPVRNSQLVDVKFRSVDPALAASVANELVGQYIAENQALKAQASKETSTWLTLQLEEQRKHVEASELALQQYREQHDAVSLADRQNIVTQKLADLNAAVTRAKTARIQKESEYTQLQDIGSDSQALDTFPAILSNAYIQSLKSELSRLQAQRAQLAGRLGDKHPEMIKTVSAIRAAQDKLDTELAKIVRSVHNEYLAAAAEENSLTAALNTQKDAAQAQNRMGIDYGVLERDAATNRQLYEGLLQRVKETGVSGELKPSNVRIVDPAEIPRTPVLPQRGSDLLFGMFSGAVLAVGLALFLEHLDNRIKTPEEIAEHLRIPCLGLVPLILDKSHGVPLVNNGVPPNFSEAFKGVRTNVLFSSTEDGSRSLVITSTGPSEGKTVVATNLALSLAQVGQRVILIDADMRRPRAHELLSLRQEPGLSNLIVGNAKASEAVLASSTPGLWILPAGRLPPNPAELLSSARFKNLLITLRDHFAWVIIDSPPIMAVTDAAVIGHLASGVVFVVGAEMASRGAARIAIDQLGAANGKLVGAVLNRVDLARDGRYYSNYYRREYDSYRTAVS